MRDELHRYLDGELAAEDLSAEARREAAAWDQLLEDVRAAGAAGAPARLEREILDAVLGEGRDPWWRRAAGWWVRPRSIRVSPLGLGLAAAAVVALALLLPFGGPVGGDGEVADAGEPGQVPGAVATATGGGAEGEATGGEAPAGGMAAVPDSAVTQVVYVKFLLEAPAARSVSLAGNFNAWSADIPLQDPDGDGVWSATVPMKPGVHEYMFVVDGSTWVTDPYADRYEEDGYGHRNAVLAIAGPGAGT